MPDEKDLQQKTPPYLPFKTFLRLISVFKENAVPQRIDPSVLGRFSGSDISAIIPALKFFNLIDKEQMVQPLLGELVKSYETHEWKQNLNKVITDSYADFINGLDLSRATRKQLEEKFSSVSGEVLKKCLRFYIAAATESGISLSSFITERQRGDRKVTKQKMDKNLTADTKKQEATEVNGRSSHMSLTDYKEFSIPIRGKMPIKIWVPENTTQDEWNIAKRQFELITQMIKIYFGFQDEQ